MIILQYAIKFVNYYNNEYFRYTTSDYDNLDNFSKYIKLIVSTDNILEACAEDNIQDLIVDIERAKLRSQVNFEYVIQPFEVQITLGDVIKR